jgi:hypothetical protein
MAAQAAGISYQSLCNYRALHKDFDDALSRALAEGAEKRLAVIEKALSSPDEAIRLRSAEWWLCHVLPQQFSRSRVEVTGPDGESLPGAQIAVLVWPHQNQNPQNEKVLDAKENRPALAAPDAN